MSRAMPRRHQFFSFLFFCQSLPKENLNNMAKSIRSKCKKRARTIKRNTIGEAQVHKILRKTIRRLNKAVTPVSQEGDGVAATGNDAFVGGAPIQKIKKLRYTFNTGLREARLREDLEDLTDDEEDQLLGVVPQLEGGGGSENALEGDMDDSEVHVVDVIEEAGVHKSSSKPLPKRDNTGRDQYDKFYGRFANTSAIPGLYESDPIFTNPKRAQAHRKKSSSVVSGAGGSAGKIKFWAKKK